MRIGLTRTTLSLLLLALLAPLPLYAGHEGGEKEKPAAKEGESKPEGEKKGEPGAAGEKDKKPAAPVIKYQLGEPLNGHYDWNVLRAAYRVTHYRYPIAEIKHAASRAGLWQVRLGLAIEFGLESGMAETADNEASITEDIHRCLDGFEPGQLLLNSGKRQLKEALIATINRRLTTAQIRQLYFTSFTVVM